MSDTALQTPEHRYAVLLTCCRKPITHDSWVVSEKVRFSSHSMEIEMSKRLFLSWPDLLSDVNIKSKSWVHEKAGAIQSDVLIQLGAHSLDKLLFRSMMWERMQGKGLFSHCLIVA